MDWQTFTHKRYVGKDTYHAVAVNRSGKRAGETSAGNILGRRDNIVIRQAELSGGQSRALCWSGQSNMARSRTYRFIRIYQINIARSTPKWSVGYATQPTYLMVYCIMKVIWTLLNITPIRRFYRAYFCTNASAGFRFCAEDQGASW